MYAHESKCDGRLIAVLPYAYDSAGHLLFLGRLEKVPQWNKRLRAVGKNYLNIIHGMMDDAAESPIETCKRELLEEAGYDVPIADIVPLGACSISKAEDSTFYLFACPIEGEISEGQLAKGVGDGSDNEEKASCVWIGDIGMSVDPLAYIAYYRLSDYLAQNIGERLLVEIREPSVDPERKMEAAVTSLQKALHFEVPVSSAARSPLRERSEFTSVNELHDLAEEEGDSKIYAAYKIVAHWLGILSKGLDSSVPFQVSGRRFIDLTTGRPLTQAQWDALEAQITAVFGQVFAGAPDLIVMQAMALGKALAALEEPQAQRTPLSQLDLKNVDLGVLEYTAALEYSRQAAASYIAEITDDARQAVRQTVVNAARARWTPTELETELFEKFADLNRDWRRVAETELQYNFQTGFLISAAEQSRAKGEPQLYLRGRSSASACDWCWAHINGKLFIYTDDAPIGGNDEVHIDGRLVTAMWPGKTNIGRKKADWWACVPAHPNCRCGTSVVPISHESDFFDYMAQTDEEKAAERERLEGKFRK